MEDEWCPSGNGMRVVDEFASAIEQPIAEAEIGATDALGSLRMLQEQRPPAGSG